MEPRLVLVTGANGYIASRLIPRLLGGGYRVRVMARQPERLQGRKWRAGVEVRAASTADAGSLASAMQGVHTAYYLIHSMSMGRGYQAIERESARRFAAAAETAKVEHIIYLGGLADPADPHLAPHMRSRIETGEVLRQGSVPVTEFRAGVITGAGSISFEMIRFLTECFPILPGPRWLLNQTQPIAADNVIDYLIAGLEKIDVRGGIYEMGGPEKMKYGEAMLRYARARGLKRWMFTLPGIPIWLMAAIVDRLTPVPYPIATALIGGLQSDSSVKDEAVLRAFPEIRLISNDAAIELALGDLTPARLERVWEGLGHDVANFRHEGFIIDHRRRRVHADAATVYAQLTRTGGSRGWPYANWLWRLRGWINDVITGPGGSTRTKDSTAKHSTAEAGDSLSVGQNVGYYRVEAAEPGRLLRLYSRLRAPGEGWMEWQVEDEAPGASQLTQTAYFAPHGLPGFLSWFALGAVHQVVFRGLIEALKRRSESP